VFKKKKKIKKAFTVPRNTV